MARVLFKLRRGIARSWLLSRSYYRFRGARLVGRPSDKVWYFAYGANMHDATFVIRRGIQPLERKAAPANLYPDPVADVWGVVYRITRRDLMHLDSTEGVPGRGYRHVEGDGGRRCDAIAYLAEGMHGDGKPSLLYITLPRDGARAQGLPADYIPFLDSIEHAV